MQHFLGDNSGMPEHISLRVPNGVTDRGERLAKALAAAPAYQGMPISRSRALTLALMRGLEVLEREYLPAGKGD